MTEALPQQTTRGEQAKNKLIQAAIAQFGEYGMNATTRDIAALAEQNIAAINYYFGSKEALYLACAHWIAGFITERTRLPLQANSSGHDVRLTDKTTARQRLHQLNRTMLHLLTDDATLNISKFVTREQFSPTEAYTVLHERLFLPMHTQIAHLVALYSGLSPDATDTVLHTHGILGEILGFRLGRNTLLLRCGWQQFDPAGTDQIARTVGQHIDFILQGLSAQRGAVNDEKK